MYDNEDNNSQSGIGDERQGVEDVKQVGGTLLHQAGGVAKSGIKKLVQGTGKVAASAGKRIAKALATTLLRLLFTLILAVPELFVIFGILGLVIFAFYALNENRGTQLQYSAQPIVQNTMTTKVINGETYQYASGSLNAMQSQILNFYQYYANVSYFQYIHGKPKRPTGKIYDYYGKENGLELNPNILYSLDYWLFNDKYKYPNQFIQPLNENLNAMQLLPLTNKQRVVNVKSNDYGPNGKTNNQQIYSVADYGLAPVFSYKKYNINNYLQGYYYKKEILVGKHTKWTNIHQPYKIQEPNYPQKVYVMTTALTFQGTHHFQYQELSSEISGLSPGQSSNDTDLVTEYHYDTGVWYSYVGSGKKRRAIPHYVPLYEMRYGAEYQVAPIETADAFDNKGNQYLNDYMANFQCFLPKNVLDGFNVSQFTGNDVLSGSMGPIGVGTSNNYGNAMEWWSYIQLYASDFGVDPYLILAQMTQESHGNPTDGSLNAGYGLMQIQLSTNGNGKDGIMGTTVAGKQVWILINTSTVSNPLTNLEIGIIMDANHIQAYEQEDHNPINDEMKAIYEYNGGSGTMDEVKSLAGSNWDTNGWLNYIQEGYSMELNGGGDPNYLAHVLAYYNSPTGKTAIQNWLKGTTIQVGTNTSSLSVMTPNHTSSATMFTITQKKGKTTAGATNQSNNFGWLGAVLDGIQKALGNSLNSVFSMFQQTYPKTAKKFEYHLYASPFIEKEFYAMNEAMNQRIGFSDSFNTNTTPTLMEKEVLPIWDNHYIYSGNGNKDDLNPSQLSGIVSDIGSFTRPLSAFTAIIEPYGPDNNIESVGMFNQGVVLSAPLHNPVYAVTGGVVSNVITGIGTQVKGLGNTITIQNNDGTAVTYGYLSRITAQKGATVSLGELIGYTGKTGDAFEPSLYFALYGPNGAALDPSSYLGLTPPNTTPPNSTGT
jgi:murein DD-endopeptidase MepM/ murein hydrolase activator NlpD